MRLWLAALGVCSAGFTAVESVPAALGLIAFWVFLVASSLLGFRRVLLWLGVLAVCSGIFAVFEPDRDAVL
jgi:hypothetical protein